MIEHVVESVLGAGIERVGVVTGHQAERLERTLSGQPVTIVPNPDYGEGLSTSLRAGLSWLGTDPDATFICLGDMPGLSSDHLLALAQAFEGAPSPMICVPSYRGTRGNPILWPRAYFEEMAALSGDRGARDLLTRYAHRVRRVEVEGPGVLRDIDTRKDLARES